MIKIQNNYHKKLAFPRIGIAIDAHEIKEVDTKSATELLNNKWISLINTGNVVGRKNINNNKKVNK